ncbi:hypothetical protein T440DRAFT_472010 [Plenodomus tracheiphilus IPT5]|uniref:Uncharacterized protein n=1 Tax=Plenodomus tracheiphilus IPT5 TaxID=1408161 RepID=A0A6A7AW41_9PLEO|nr:hypothetical protein T440DRAFT_472010 [Plenodomus tracheiphilus IPT5]
MSTECRTCDHRNHAMKAWRSAPSQLDVCVIDLSFKSPTTVTQTEQCIAMNTLLNNIVDYEAATTSPSTFTVWSPCMSDTKTAVIVTTVSEVCSHGTAPIFDIVARHLTRPPYVRHVYLDMAVLSLAASSPEQRIPCDIMQLHGPNPDVAVAIGKMFGWDPKRSAISHQLQTRASAGFTRPGDLVRDLWAWVELPQTILHQSPRSTGSHESLSTSLILSNINSAEKKISLPFQEEDYGPPPYMEDESLMMIFQWNSHADGDRFKDHEQESYGPNGEPIRKNMWQQQIARPISNLQRLGARLVVRRLELRAVDPRLEGVYALSSAGPAARARSGSKRLGLMAAGLSGKVSELWR